MCMCVCVCVCVCVCAYIYICVCVCVTINVRAGREGVRQRGVWRGGREQGARWLMDKTWIFGVVPPFLPPSLPPFLPSLPPSSIPPSLPSSPPSLPPPSLPSLPPLLFACLSSILYYITATWLSPTTSTPTCWTSSSSS